MTSIKTITTAAIGAGVALLAGRIPVPDGSVLDRAAQSLGHDAIAGLRAIPWELQHIVRTTGIDARIQDAIEWIVGLAPETMILVAVSTGVGLTALAALLHRRTRSRSRRRRPIRTPDRRVTQARTLARKGAIGLDVARETSLSRDAVALVARIHRPDGVAGGGRRFRQTGAG